jgi:hypothetical protein
MTVFGKAPPSYECVSNPRRYLKIRPDIFTVVRLRRLETARYLNQARRPLGNPSTDDGLKSGCFSIFGTVANLTICQTSLSVMPPNRRHFATIRTL